MTKAAGELQLVTKRKASHRASGDVLQLVLIERNFDREKVTSRGSMLPSDSSQRSARRILFETAVLF